MREQSMVIPRKIHSVFLPNKQENQKKNNELYQLFRETNEQLDRCRLHTKETKEKLQKINNLFDIGYKLYMGIFCCVLAYIFFN